MPQTDKPANKIENKSIDTLDRLISLAKIKGADHADALYAEGRSIGVSWRDGALEDLDGSEGADLGLRVMIGHKQATASTSDHSAHGLSMLVDRTLAMAHEVPEDPYCCLAPQDQLYTGPIKGLDLYDSYQPGAEDLRELARRADDAARAVKGITNTDGGSASSGHFTIALMTSDGFRGTYQSSSFSLSVSAHGEKDGAMERDYDFSSARHFADLKSPEDIGQTAANLTLKRLGAVKMKSGRMPVVFDPRVSNSLIDHFLSAINGNSIAMGTSFLADKLGKAIFNPSVTIIDDPTRIKGLKSRYFDGEGVQVRKSALAEKGVLNTWIVNAATARQLGVPVTGHASRGTGGTPGISTGNVYVAAGTDSPENLIADIADGLYVTELIGMGVNGVTGDYSRGAAGFKIRNGQIEESVSEITIAGNLMDMFENLTPANDLHFKYGINAPTLRVDGMMIAGN